MFRGVFPEDVRRGWLSPLRHRPRLSCFCSTRTASLRSVSFPACRGDTFSFGYLDTHWHKEVFWEEKALNQFSRWIVLHQSDFQSNKLGWPAWSVWRLCWPCLEVWELRCQDGGRRSRRRSLRFAQGRSKRTPSCSSGCALEVLHTIAGWDLGLRVY